MAIPRAIFIVPMPPSANNQYLVSRNRLIATKELRAFAAESALKLSRQVNAQADVLAELRRHLRLVVNCRFAFEEKRLWTKDQRVKRLDVKNRIKAVHDSIAAKIQIDDSRFWSGYDEKAVVLLGQPEHVEVHIEPFYDGGSHFTQLRLMGTRA